MSAEPSGVGDRPLGMHQTIALAAPRPAGVVTTAEVVVVTPPDGFEDFFRQNYERTVRVAYLMVGFRQVAEDVVQDAFARVELRWTKLDEPGVYLYKAVVNRSREILRRRSLPRLGRRRERSDDLGADELAQALAALPAKRRAAVVLRFYDGLDESEIAAVLGLRAGAVHALLRRAMAELREVIER